MLSLSHIYYLLLSALIHHLLVIERKRNGSFLFLRAELQADELDLTIGANPSRFLEFPERIMLSPFSRICLNLVPRFYHRSKILSGAIPSTRYLLSSQIFSAITISRSCQATPSVPERPNYPAFAPRNANSLKKKIIALSRCSTACPTPTGD
jgi:hypothetical protein